MTDLVPMRVKAMPLHCIPNSARSPIRFLPNQSDTKRICRNLFGAADTVETEKLFQETNQRNRTHYLRTYSFDIGGPVVRTKPYEGKRQQKLTEHYSQRKSLPALNGKTAIVAAAAAATPIKDVISRLPPSSDEDVAANAASTVLPVTSAKTTIPLGETAATNDELAATAACCSVAPNEENPAAYNKTSVSSMLQLQSEADQLHTVTIETQTVNNVCT